MGIEIKCFDEDDRKCRAGSRGEVVIRGHNVMKGYYKRPEATEKAFTTDGFTPATSASSMRKDI